MGLGNIGEYIDENWHGGEIDGDFFYHPEMTIEESSAPAPKPKTIAWNWKRVVVRELMRGKHANDILAKYRPVIDRFGIEDDVRRCLERYDGVIGWLVVDVSSFDEKFDYCDMPEEMRRFNLYAVNATEIREVLSRSLVSENDGSIDGFLNSDDNVSETVCYQDEHTGLPCIDSVDDISDDSDPRLSGIAGMLLERGWISSSEKERFSGMSGKLAFIARAIRRHFRPKASAASGDYQDDVKDFDVRSQDLEADSIGFHKDAEVNNVHEVRIDDIGDVDIKRGVDVNIMRENRLDDIGDVDVKKDLSIVNDLSKRDFCGDIDIADEAKPVAVTEVDEPVLDEIDGVGPSVDYGTIDDNLTELKDSDFEDDITFDFDDLKDETVDVDLDEMMDEDSMKDDVEYDEKPAEIEISEKYDWGW